MKEIDEVLCCVGERAGLSSYFLTVFIVLTNILPRPSTDEGIGRIDGS